MKKQFFLFTCILLFISSAASAQYANWAVGGRLGEPTGLNIRKYFGDSRAVDLNIGTYGGLYGTNRSYRSGKYKNVGICFQGHYIQHTGLFKKEEFRGYYGIGGQVAIRQYFPDNLANQPVDNVSETSLGGSGIAGLEYFVSNKPYSFFLETGLYAEVLPALLYFNIQSGIGIRFNL